jgi:uncharacterized membrane protein
MAWNLYDVVHLLVRWLHVLCGIIWLGHLFFFNFVNVPMQASLDDAAKKILNPQLMPRALWWFRWGAMITFLAGLWLFTQIYMYAPGVGFGPSSFMYEPGGGISDRALWIMTGMTLGTIMWFNVWFIIWPAQRKILGGTAAAEELPILRRRAAITSKVNTYLSAPMLFCMLAPNHYSAFNLPSIIVFLIIAVFTIAHFFMFSGKVGRKV